MTIRQLISELGDIMGIKRNTYGFICRWGDYSANLGDDIQSLAALQYMKRADFYIHIDKVASFRGEER